MYTANGMSSPSDLRALLRLRCLQALRGEAVSRSADAASELRDRETLERVLTWLQQQGLGMTGATLRAETGSDAHTDGQAFVPGSCESARRDEVH